VSIRLELFRRKAESLMDPTPVVVPYGTPIRTVVERMAAGDSKTALVTKATGGLIGILTDQDVTRRIVFRVSPETPVERVMTTPVRTIRQDDYLYRAIGLMRRYRVRQIPCLDAHGQPAGLLELHDAIAATAEQLIEQVDKLAVPATTAGMRAAKSAQVDLATELFEADVPAPEIQQLLTDINRDIYRRIVERMLEYMADAGWGKPPVDFDVLIMGSGGRGENFLTPDQDNGFILNDYPDQEHTYIDSFFIELAERMTQELDAVGFPLCRGYVMATNPVWRKTLSQWQEQTLIWSRRISFVTARLVGIFIDFRGTYGPGHLTESLRRHVTERVGKSRGFLRELHRNEEDNSTALGWFNWLTPETDDKRHKGEINLKLRGTLPLVDATRLASLLNGVAETSTLGRIAGLQQAGFISRDQKEYLDDAFEHITGLLLHQQLTDFRARREVTTFIHPGKLSRRDHERLVDAFNAIEHFRNKLRAQFTADGF